MAIADVSAVVLSRMNISVPDGLDGRVPPELARPAATALPLTAASPAARTEGSARVEERLRRLGYIE